MKRLHLFLVLLLFPLTLVAAESAKNREDSFLYLSWSPLGIHADSLSAPVRLGLILGSSIVVGGEKGQANSELSGNTKINGQDYSETKGTLTYQSQGVFLRWFPGNSFNFYLGRFHRELSGSVTEKAKDDGSTIAKYEMEGSVDATIFGIGNLWTFDSGFFIGADWVLGGSVSNYESQVNQTEGEETSSYSFFDDKEDYEKLVNLMVRDLNKGGVAVLRLGWMF